MASTKDGSKHGYIEARGGACGGFLLLDILGSTNAILTFGQINLHYYAESSHSFRESWATRGLTVPRTTKSCRGPETLSLSFPVAATGVSRLYERFKESMYIAGQGLLRH